MKDSLSSQRTIGYQYEVGPYAARVNAHVYDLDLHKHIPRGLAPMAALHGQLVQWSVPHCIGRIRKADRRSAVPLTIIGHVKEIRCSKAGFCRHQELLQPWTAKFCLTAHPEKASYAADSEDHSSSVIARSDSSTASEGRLWQRDQLTTIECNIDDMSPQVLAYACEQLISAGALDAWIVQVGSLHLA